MNAKKTIGKLLALVMALMLLWPVAAMCEQGATPSQAETQPPAPTNSPAPEGEKGSATVGNMEKIVIERKQTMTLAVPVAFRVGGNYWYTNMLSSGSIVKYDPTRSAMGYSADICEALDSLTVEITQEGDSPFYKKSIASKRYVVATLSDTTAKQLGFEAVQDASGQKVYKDPLSGKLYKPGTKYNAGFAVFEGLVVHTNVRNGAYEIPVKIRWESSRYGSGSATVTLQATAQNSDVEESGSGTTSTYYYGGGGGSGATSQAKLIVSGVSTVPENPVAGDEFDIVLKLYNTSATETVSNITINCDAESDAVLPVSGSFSAYAPSIAPGKALEQTFRVRAQSDIDDEPVKMYVTVDYEDKKANAYSVSQTVVINVAQLMRIKLDEPVLPGDASIAGESYSVSMGVFNLGRTTLYNVTVTAKSEDANLNPGAAYYCGNMEMGTSKTAEIRLTPLEAGTYTADIEVTYENGRGETFSESKTVSFYAESYEEEDWFGDLPEEEPEQTPEPGPGRKAMEIASILPWWIYLFVGGLFVLAVVCIGVSARHRRIRAYENDEME